ncbi:MAG: ribose 5-phosphate isomerase B [Bdellovibrionota bacterium]
MSTSRRSVLIASDHAGFDLKERLKAKRPDIEWIDKGPTDTSRVDYPDFADRVAREVVRDGKPGVLVCGSGQGMAMRANKHRGIRAALVYSDEIAKLAREHNDANILCLGARVSDHTAAERWLELFLTTKFEGGRHTDRVKKIGTTAEC